MDRFLIIFSVSFVVVVLFRVFMSLLRLILLHRKLSSHPSLQVHYHIVLQDAVNDALNVFRMCGYF